jgi:hypothetical protein
MPILAFLFLGFLIGNLVGLSADGAVKAILPLLFAFGGCSAVGLFHKLEDRYRKIAYQLIFTLSISCLIGTYTGIIVSEYRLLSSKNGQTSVAANDSRKNKYLFVNKAISKADAIDQLLAAKKLKIEDAYKELYDIITQLEKNNEE